MLSNSSMNHAKLWRHLETIYPDRKFKEEVSSSEAWDICRLSEYDY
jgi:hypothetical protein